MKNLRNINVPLDKIATTAAQVSDSIVEIDNLPDIEPVPDYSVAYDHQKRTIRSLRGQLVAFQKSLHNLLGASHSEHLPEIIIGNFRAQEDNRRSYAQAQTLYSVPTLTEAYDSKTGVAIARALSKFFTLAGFDCRSWDTFVETNSLVNN